LWSKYPASSSGELKKTGVLLKNDFKETTYLASFYEFATNSGKYLTTYSFLQREVDGVTWRLLVTNYWNNGGNLIHTKRRKLPFHNVNRLETVICIVVLEPL
jgi:hypothetical protein